MILSWPKTSSVSCSSRARWASPPSRWDGRFLAEQRAREIEQRYRELLQERARQGAG
jgi:hypothetical protein